MPSYEEVQTQGGEGKRTEVAEGQSAQGGYFFPFLPAASAAAASSSRAFLSK